MAYKLCNCSSPTIVRLRCSSWTYPNECKIISLLLNPNPVLTVFRFHQQKYGVHMLSELARSRESGFVIYLWCLFYTRLFRVVRGGLVFHRGVATYGQVAHQPRVLHLLLCRLFCVLCISLDGCRRHPISRSFGTCPGAQAG